MSDIGKNRQWTAVLYNENMREGWRDDIDSLVQLPYAYCVHDRGLDIEKDERRKVHTHIILVWPAPTTYKHAMEVFRRLDAPGKRSLNTCEPVYNARRMYDYLIHDTEDSRKKGKFLFPQSERVTGNNYDIGSYEQVSQAEKNEAFDKLTEMVFAYEITNFADFVLNARALFPDQVELMRDVMRGYSGYFDRLIKGNFFRRNEADLARSEGKKEAGFGDLHEEDEKMEDKLKDIFQKAAEDGKRGVFEEWDKGGFDE